MKIRMTANYSDRDDHPMKGDTLDVLEVIYEGKYLECYRCNWGYREFYVYPYECEEIL